MSGVAVIEIALPDRPARSDPVDATSSPDGRWVAWCCNGGQWGVADATSGRVVRHGTAGTAGQGVRFSPGGHHLAVATAGRLHLREVEPWRPIGAADTGLGACGLGFTADGATAVVFSGGGVVGGWDRLSAASAAGRGPPRFADGTIVFVSVADAQVTAVVNPHLPRAGIGRQNFNALAVSPDGRHVAWGEGATLLLAAAATGEPTWTAVAHPGGIGAVAFSPDGRTLASSDHGQIGLWDASTGCRRSLIGSGGGRQLAFTPDGLTVVGVSAADRIDLWWATDGSLRERIPAAGARGQAIAVAANGQSIAFGRFGSDGLPSIGIVPVRPGLPPPVSTPASLLGPVPTANRLMADRVAAANRTARYRSGPPPIDLARFASFAPLARVAVRLHPRRSADVDARASHVGGTVLWPNGEAWPTCPDHGEPMAVVAQLLRADVPELPFPAGSNLCQLFWCERRHDDRRPRAAVVWRGASAGLSPQSPTVPVVADRTPAWRPVPCAVWPERIIDYPGDRDDIEVAAPGAFDLVEAAHPEMADYAGSLGAAPGFKVGGHPRWVQDAETPTCDRCGQPMRLLVQAGSWEFDGTEGQRWRPAGLAPVAIAGRLAQMSPTVPLDGGGDGSVFLFTCPVCDPGRIEAVYQR